MILMNKTEEHFSDKEKKGGMLTSLKFVCLPGRSWTRTRKRTAYVSVFFFLSLFLSFDINNEAYVRLCLLFTILFARRL